MLGTRRTGSSPGRLLGREEGETSLQMSLRAKAQRRGPLLAASTRAQGEPLSRDPSEPLLHACAPSPQLPRRDPRAGGREPRSGGAALGVFLPLEGLPGQPRVWHRRAVSFRTRVRLPGRRGEVARSPASPRAPAPLLLLLLLPGSRRAPYLALAPGGHGRSPLPPSRSRLASPAPGDCNYLFIYGP